MEVTNTALESMLDEVVCRTPGGNCVGNCRPR